MSKLDQLTQRYLDGSITPEHEEELFSHLRDTPQALEEFVELIMLDEAMMEVVPLETKEHDQPKKVRNPLRGDSKRGVRRRAPRARQKPKSPIPFILFTSAAAVLVMGIGLAVWWVNVHPKTTSIAQLLRETGGITVTRNGKDIPLPDRIQSGDHLTTDGDARTRITFDDGSTVVLRANVDCVVTDGPEGKRINLKRGRIESTVSPQKFPFSIKTGHAIIKVIGTRFTTTARPLGTRVDVTKGLVEVLSKAAKQSVRIGPGQYAVASPSSDFTVHTKGMTPVPTAQVGSFTLMNPNTGKPIKGYTPIQPGATISLSNLPCNEVNVRADVTDGPVTAVVFGFLSDSVYQIELGRDIRLFTLFHDNDGILGSKRLSPGEYTVTARTYHLPSADPDMTKNRIAKKRKAYERNNDTSALGAPGKQATLRFTVVP